MTNKEYLNALTNEKLVSWLGEEQDTAVQTTEAQTTDWSLYPNFKPKEFVCGCGKCQYSTVEGVMDMNPNLLQALQILRKYYGKSITITCGWRDQTYNDSLVGSIKTSKHLTGDAADFYIPGVTNTESGREGVIKLLKAMPKYRYAYHNVGGKYPNMGAAVHADFNR